MSPAMEGPNAPRSTRRISAHWITVFALGIAALVLFPLIGKSGIWDPYELDSAELARRIAVNVWGARSLELPGSPNTLPTLTDLKMGELPFTSMALGFKALGLRDFTGRLPLAVWGFAGACALYACFARLVSKKAGLYAIVALVTMPLYFIQARTMLGDIVTMAALTMAFAGLCGAMFDEGAAARSIWAVTALVGLASGYLSRGLLLGVAVPSLSLGLAWVVLEGSGVLASTSTERRSPAALRVIGAIALLIGVAATAAWIRIYLRTSPDAPLARALGVALLKRPPVEATFDLTIRQLGHALFPWSAFLPFAIGRMFRAPPSASSEDAAREVALRVALITGAAVAFAATALLAPIAGPLPYAAPALLAGIAAAAIHDFERGSAPSSRAIALGTVVLAFVLYRDISTTPEKALSAFSVDRPTFPKSFESEALSLMRAATALFAGLVALAWLEGPGEGEPSTVRAWAQKRREQYTSGLAELSRVWAGNLVFTAIVIEAALVGLGGMLFIGKRVGWGPVDRLPKYFVDIGLNAWWAAPVIAAIVIPLYWALRDGFSAASARVRVPRAAFTIVAALLSGGALSLFYYPALAAQLSPKEVFDAYARLRSPGEPLALLGVRSRAATYYQGGGEVESFNDVNPAFTWLTRGSGPRRWLVVKADDLPKLNSLYRKERGKNLPVLDGRSSQILLVSSELGDHRNESWLSSIVLDEPAAPMHPLDVLFEDQLECLGWEVVDAKGRLQEAVVPQTKYKLRLYLRVLRPVTGSWKVFIHIDGYQRRFNGDHAALDGRYPISLWQPGDVLVDEYEVQLEPNFTPGDYTVYFGFFSGDTRFRVTRGPEHENRVIGGALRVR